MHKKVLVSLKISRSNRDKLKGFIEDVLFSLDSVWSILRSWKVPGFF